MITIRKKDLNFKILLKILNSVAGKYNCGVRFHAHGRHLNYEGDEACASEIYAETIGIFRHTNAGRESVMTA